MSRLNTTDVFLIQWDKADEADRNQQRWAHAHALHDHEARAIHDWDACPDCDRIGFDRRFANLPKMSPHQQHLRKVKFERRQRRSATRRAKRRLQRASV